MHRTHALLCVHTTHGVTAPVLPRHRQVIGVEALLSALEAMGVDNAR
jgi:hypothetical protein